MNRILVHELAANAKFNRFHGLLLLMCILIIMADGYDLAVIGVALPMIMKDMGVSPQQAGLMASAAVFGMMFGAAGIGAITDRVGRRPTMLACLSIASFGTMVTGLTHDPISFSLARFLTGLAIGGVMPSVVTQMTEFAPRSARTTMVTLAFSGFAIGGILAAAVGKALIALYGWPSVFLVAGLQILLIPLMFRFMPESIAVLMRKGRTTELESIAQRLQPTYRSSGEDKLFRDAPMRRDVVPSRSSRLFKDGNGSSTAMFWTASFMCLFVTYGLATWLVKLMTSAGYELGSALNFILILNIGGLAGQVGGGMLADRLQIKWVLFGLYLLGAASILMLSNKLPAIWLYVFVALLGAAIYGAQTLTYAYAGQFYPPSIRSAGVGWTSAVGRLGAIVGPIAFGFVIALVLPLEHNFIAFAAPLLLAALAVSFIRSRPAAACTKQESISLSEAS